MPDTRSRFLVDPLLRRVVEAYLFRGLGFLLLFVMHLRLGRTLGPGDYGIFNFGLMTASLWVIFSSLGWPTAVLRLFAEYSEKKQWGLLIGASKRSIQIVVGVSLVFSVGLIMVASVDYFGIEQKIGLRFAALLLPVLALIGLIRKCFMAFDKTNTSIALEDILIPSLFMAGVMALNLAGVVQVSVAYLATVCVTLFVSLFVFRTVFRSNVPSAPAEYRTGYWSRIAVAMVMGGVAQILLNRVDVLMLGVMVEMESVGIYVASNRLAMVSTISLIAVNTVVAPRMAKAYHGGNFEGFRHVLIQGTAWSAIGSLPIVVLLLLLPGVFLNLFGSGFDAGVSILRILTIGQFANALTGPAAFALLVTGRERQFAVTMSLLAALNVVGNLIAIPIAGALGAAIASAVCVSVLNVWQYRLALAIGP